MFYLRKQNNHEVGDSGPMSLLLTPIRNDDGKIIDVKYEAGARPAVNSVIRVGSYSARSNSKQDWWQTSTISEIVSDETHKMVFKTQSGSIYEWGVV